MSERQRRLNRREAIGLIGASAAVGIVSASRSGGGFFDWGLEAAAAPQFPKGAIIRTVLKDLPPDALSKGATLFHEHLSLTSPYPYQAPPSRPVPPHVTSDVDLMIEEVRAATREGIVCYVDGGHPDMGRSIDALKRISTATGLQIVASGGYYTQSAYPPEIAKMSEEAITELLVKEARRDHLGAFGEIGSSEQMTPDERKVFRAIGKAHLRTNIPIFTHNAYTGSLGRSGPSENALEQLDLFESLGVKPAHVVIGHLCCKQDTGMHKAIAKRGAWVGFDRIGLVQTMPDEERVKMVLAMLEAGYADRLLFAGDGPFRPWLKKEGGPGLAQVVTRFLPMLRKAGVKDETLHTITVDNPRRFLAFAPRNA